MKKLLKTIVVIFVIIGSLIYLNNNLGVLDFSASKPVTGEQLLRYSDNYYFNKLEENEKKIYIRIDEAVKLKEKEVDLYNITLDNAKELVSTTFEAYLNDNPKNFYLSNNYTIVTNSVAGFEFLDLLLEYNRIEDVKSMNSEMENAIDEIINRVIKEDMTDYEKELALHDELASTVKYYKFENIQDIPYIKHTAYSALVKKEAVCDGYAKAYKLLLDEVGIDSIVLTGDLEGEPHAWNMVQIDNEYYHVDVTADNVEQGSNMYAIHAYFNNTDEEIKLTHKKDKRYTVPECYSDAYNYYEISGKILKSEDNIYNKLRNIVSKLKQEKILEVKVNNKFDAEEIVDTLYDLNFNNWKTNWVTNINYLIENDVYIFER